MEFSIGKKVRHIHTGDSLWVLRVGNEQILCRTQDLREIWFYPHELEEVTPMQENRNTQRFL